MRRRILKTVALTLSICMVTACSKAGTTPTENDNSGDVETTDIADTTEKSDSNIDSENDNTGKSDNDQASENDGQSKDEGSDANINADIENASEETSAPNLSTNEEILSFIAGDWTLVNSSTGEDFGTMTFREDGTCTFTRLEDKVSCDGEIEFQKGEGEGENPEAYSLQIDELGQFLPDSGEGYLTNEIPTSGIFHIGIGEGKDYLYLSEEGNGDTWISYAVFNKYQPDAYSSFFQDWKFYRKNDISASSDSASGEEFYAFAWGREDGKLLLQKMIPHEFETYDEYTDRAFTAAYFIEDSDIAVRCYELSDSANTDKLFREDIFDRSCPLYVYSVKTDSEGKISDIKEVDEAFYGMYDMGNLEPVIECKDDTFYYNNSTYKLGDFAPGATAIMDCQRAGDFIILDCHVNPHYGLYVFFNIYRGDFVYSIMGANLIWKGDDLSTAVYSRYNEIYDFWGNLIGNIDEAEVFGLAFNGDDKLDIECWKVEGEEEKTFTEQLEYEPVDHAMFNYLRYYFSNAASRYTAFVEDAPEDAVAFVIENATGEIADLLSPAIYYEDGAKENLTVISLVNNAKVSIEPTDSDISTTKKHIGEVVDMLKGQKQMFCVSIAEVMGNDNLVIQTDDGKKVTWPIVLISGRVPQKSTFVQ